MRHLRRAVAPVYDITVNENFKTVAKEITNQLGEAKYEHFEHSHHHMIYMAVKWCEQP